MKGNGVFFLITLIFVFATYISLGRRQYRNPRPTIQAYDAWEANTDCIDPTHPNECKC